MNMLCVQIYCPDMDTRRTRVVAKKEINIYLVYLVREWQNHASPLG